MPADTDGEHPRSDKPLAIAILSSLVNAAREHARWIFVEHLIPQTIGLVAMTVLLSQWRLGITGLREVTPSVARWLCVGIASRAIGDVARLGRRPRGPHGTIQSIEYAFVVIYLLSIASSGVQDAFIEPLEHWVGFESWGNHEKLKTLLGGVHDWSLPLSLLGLAVWLWVSELGRFASNQAKAGAADDGESYSLETWWETIFERCRLGALAIAWAFLSLVSAVLRPLASLPGVPRALGREVRGGAVTPSTPTNAAAAAEARDRSSVEEGSTSAAVLWVRLIVASLQYPAVVAVTNSIVQACLVTVGIQVVLVALSPVLLARRQVHVAMLLACTVAVSSLTTFVALSGGVARIEALQFDRVDALQADLDRLIRLTSRFNQRASSAASEVVDRFTLLAAGEAATGLLSAGLVARRFNPGKGAIWQYLDGKRSQWSERFAQVTRQHPECRASLPRPGEAARSMSKSELFDRAHAIANCLRRHLVDPASVNAAIRDLDVQIGVIPRREHDLKQDLAMREIAAPRLRLPRSRVSAADDTQRLYGELVTKRLLRAEPTASLIALLALCLDLGTVLALGSRGGAN